MRPEWVQRVEVILDGKPHHEQSEVVRHGLYQLSSIFEQALEGAKNADRSNKNFDLEKTLGFQKVSNYKHRAKLLLNLS